MQTRDSLVPRGLGHARTENTPDQEESEVILGSEKKPSAWQQFVALTAMAVVIVSDDSGRATDITGGVILGMALYPFRRFLALGMGIIIAIVAVIMWIDAFASNASGGDYLRAILATAIGIILILVGMTEVRRPSSHSES